MRFRFAFLSAVVLALAVAVPAFAQEPYVSDIHVTSVQVNKMGEMHILGYLYCQNIGSDWKVEERGQAIQAIGRKTTVRGGIGGGFHCNPNGPTYFDAWSWADWGKYTNTWTTIQLGFGTNWCDENGCWWQDYGGQNFYLKATK